MRSANTCAAANAAVVCPEGKLSPPSPQPERLLLSLGRSLRHVEADARRGVVVAQLADCIGAGRQREQRRSVAQAVGVATCGHATVDEMLADAAVDRVRGSDRRGSDTRARPVGGIPMQRRERVVAQVPDQFAATRQASSGSKDLGRDGIRMELDSGNWTRR
jgi:hypothetical protein